MHNFRFTLNRVIFILKSIEILNYTHESTESTNCVFVFYPYLSLFIASRPNCLFRPTVTIIYYRHSQSLLRYF